MDLFVNQSLKKNKSKSLFFRWWLNIISLCIFGSGLLSSHHF